MKAELKRALGLSDAAAELLLKQQTRIRVGANGDGWTLITSTNRHIGVFGNNPAPDADDVMSIPASVVRAAVEQALRMDAATASAAADQDLSEGGRTRKLAPTQRESAQALAAAYASLRAFVADLEKQERARYNVPPATTPAEIALDCERRTVFRALAETDQLQELERMLRSDADDDAQLMLLALLRFRPLMGTAAKFALTGWHDLIDRRDPAGRERLTQMRAAADWASSVLNTIAAALMPSYTSGMHSRENIWLLTREHDAASLFGINSGEVSQFQRRFALTS